MELIQRWISRWNRSVRDPRVWHPHPLAIPVITSIKDFLDYEELFYYISPLLEAEINVQMHRLTEKQNYLNESKKKRKLSHIPADVNAWRAQLIEELNANVTISAPEGDPLPFIQMYMDVNMGDYRKDQSLS